MSSRSKHHPVVIGLVLFLAASLMVGCAGAAVGCAGAGAAAGGAGVAAGPHPTRFRPSTATTSRENNRRVGFIFSSFENITGGRASPLAHRAENLVS